MKIALVQFTSGSDEADNLERADLYVKQASKKGAKWILFPENLPYMGPHPIDHAHKLKSKLIDHYSNLASDLDIWITLGSFREEATPTHTYNTQVTLSPKGEVKSFYRKIHLFDVELKGMTIRESDTMIPGKEIEVFQLGDFRVGASICYDLRFPELYRSLVKKGATILIVPSAFTKKTGAAHWHALLRARAIENQCFVLAPNQFGNHYADRWSFGGSVVYDPWGEQLALADEKECVIYADLDPGRIRTLREEMPVLEHHVLE